MGLISWVACRDCLVVRDLDKFYALRSAKTRDEASAIAAEIRELHSYRAALLASFMFEHKTHRCTLFDEHDDLLVEEFVNDYVKEESDEFWIAPTPPLKVPR